MIIEFPKPLKKKSTWVEVDQDIWDGIDMITEEKGITIEQAISTLVRAAYIEHEAQTNSGQDVLRHSASIHPATKRVIIEGQQNEVDIKSVIYEKKCNICLQDKLSDEFYNDKRMKDGKSLQCKVCWKAKYEHPAAYKPVAPIKELPTTKKCGSCKKIKDISTEFSLDIRNRDGAQAYCKDCVRIKKFGKPLIFPVADKINNPTFFKPYQKNQGVSEDAHISESATDCALPSCERRLIKGMGKMYKGQEYCRDKCLEDFLNGGSVSELGDLVAPTRELDLRGDQA